ncbi:protocatechuate 4,5-dioxygenase subunit alpha [Vibrio sp. SS-MA-C1-2]|uniref:protocatechuate 4,5-dioxygenase subunit alpha n=1 Tax=Vibrio sp. SS-MA-C1-2 TaxID=2908646 RepID=UPI001F2681B9|nr:protocatechuate 4,5-dioxygenase subunit alpha [Vibrio sp. SS-MA-C1-2]UJF17847.1 protocatechuate 4,5-dioxygenase subunit alpha [Vibrio sp. SS-MA-C1-2]
MSSYLNNKTPIEGTTLFDGAMSRKGYGLNKMCFSFNEQDARDQFNRDEAAYCDKFGVTPEQKEAILKRDVLKLLELGGSIYYLAKFTGMLGLTIQDVGAIQTGMTVEEFKDKLVAAGK